MDALGDCCNSLRCIWKITKYCTLIGHIGVMDDMLFQHNNARSTLCTSSVIVRVLLAEEVVTGKVGRMAPEENTIACLAWAQAEWLEEFSVHRCGLRYMYDNLLSLIIDYRPTIGQLHG